MLRKSSSLVLVAVMSATVCLARKPGEPLKPGFNFFSKDQDVQVGKEAAAQVRQKMQVVQNQFLQDYITRVGKRLASQPEAGGYAFSFTLVNEKSINAFALPGGPTFVHTGLLAAADNEGELAGVLAHEISHVALRHGTHQASKANLIQLPVMLAGAIVADGSLLGQLAQVGIGLGANSYLLKFSRDSESEADALGTHLMAEAGWNPIEMAHFFETLERAGGKQPPQFLSDHPNPGNRVKAVEAEIQTLPRRTYDYGTGDFERAKRELGQIPTAQASDFRGGGADPAAARPSGQYHQLKGHKFSFSYPDNWQPLGDNNTDAVTIAPREGLVQDAQGNIQVGYGIMASYFFPEKSNNDLRAATGDLIDHLHASNPGMQPRGSQRRLKLDGYPALVTTLTNTSPYRGSEETDALVTVQRPDGVFYMIFVAPSSEFRNLDGVFNDIVNSIRFSN
jgi:predicted Zn-dependent protease